MADDVMDYVAEAQNRAWDVPGLAADTKLLPVASVGMIGAGTMGGGIAMNFANVGIPVTLVEQTQSALDRGFAVIRRNYENSARRGRFPMEEVDIRMSRLTGALDKSALKDVDLVIEAVFEDLSLKKEIFRELDGICKPGAILATNTSGLDIDAIAAETGRPESVIGMHFFSPANVMKLLEVVRADKTAKPVIATAMDLARRIGKIAVLVGVCPGFVGNRMLFQRQNQANALLLEGAMPWDVDGVLNRFGFKMGPFAMSDLAGLDIGWKKETSNANTLREVLCEHGRLGQKNGRGYYDYDADRKPSPSPEVEAFVRDFAARRGAVARRITDEEIEQRLLYPMINEAAKILQEGKALRASDVDVVWLHGYGWPANTGGPMHHADSIGLPKILAQLEAFEQQHGAFFKPAPLLRKLAGEGRGFGDLAEGEARAA